MFNRRTLGALVLGATTVFAACDSDDPIESEIGTIVEVAADAGQFNTLITAAVAAGLDDELSDPNANLTVFAPTDAAFAALPAGTLDALLADTDALAQILLYHVVAGEQDAAAVLDQSFIRTLNGQSIVIGEAGSQPTASGAVIVSTNIEASNGIIHVIDAVMIPETRNIVEIAAQDGFNTLAAAVTAANLVETLSDAESEFTVFAPTDAAFAALPAGTLDALLADPAALANILLYHTVEGRVFSDAVVSASSVPTVEGSNAPVSVTGGTVTIDGATIVTTDVQATNGVIHVIDAVITP
jgi:uncharacterized surface protein with fasciclin (FAS1) repeats